ncbi:MAG: hypothetical protein IJ131_07160 [Eggerthellaceae bacterium]|nr:hypothetical protein [Eggerthellaceae bacterium]
MRDSTSGPIISRYVMSAFSRSQANARVPRQKPDDMRTVATARIALSVQYASRFAYLPFGPVDIRADSAEWYGYTDLIPYNKAPSMLDVIVQMHEIIYKEAFNEKTCRSLLDIDEEGIVQTMLSLPGRYACFVINGQYAYDANSEYGDTGYRGLGYAETPINDLDVIEIFCFPESVGLDYYTYFMKPDGGWARLGEVAPGEPITLRHEGFLFAFGGPFEHEDRIERRMVAPMVGSQLAFVDADTLNLVDLAGAKTDEDGLATFTFYEPGDYYVTAYGGVTSRAKANVSLPWMPFVVR